VTSKSSSNSKNFYHIAASLRLLSLTLRLPVQLSSCKKIVNIILIRRHLSCLLLKQFSMLADATQPTPDYGLGTVGKCLGPTTSKGPTKDGCKIC